MRFRDLPIRSRLTIVCGGLAVTAMLAGSIGIWAHRGSVEALGVTATEDLPAIINAVCDALGITINTIPLTPERLMTILDGGEIVPSAQPKEPRASARADSQTGKDHQ